MAEYKAPIYSHAREVLSLGSQARLGDADSYVHAGMCAAQPRQPGDLVVFTEHFGGRVRGLRMAVVSLLSSLCLPVVTTRRGEPGR